MTGKWKYLIGAFLVVLLICGGTASYILAKSGRTPSREPDQEIEFVETRGSFFIDPTGREPGARIDEQGARELFILCRSAVLPELPPPSKEYIDSIRVEKVLDVVDNCTQMRVSGPDFFMGVQTQDCCIFNMQYLGPYDDPNAKFVPISEKEAREKGERLMDTLQGLEVLFAARYHLDREETQYSIEHVHRSSLTGVDAYHIDGQRVSPSGIPYHQQWGGFMLRADGLFINGGFNKKIGCSDTKPRIKEKEAVALANSIFAEMEEESKQRASNLPSSVREGMTYTVKPATSASLVYVVPDWSLGRSIGERWREESRRRGTTVAPLIEQKNRLAWLVKAAASDMKGRHSGVEVWVDALTGDVIGGKSLDFW